MSSLQNINDIAGKISKNDKYVFIFGSEGKGIKRLIKENCKYYCFYSKSAKHK